jgi:hypothetical protein
VRGLNFEADVRAVTAGNIFVGSQRTHALMTSLLYPLHPNITTLQYGASAASSALSLLQCAVTGQCLTHAAPVLMPALRRSESLR